MIDYEEELKKFEPCLDVREAEGAIYDRELTDILDVLQEVLREAKSNRRVKIIRRILQMNCVNCGAFLTDMDLDYCPSCGYNVLIQKKVDYLSKSFIIRGWKSKHP